MCDNTQFRYGKHPFRHAFRQTLHDPTLVPKRVHCVHFLNSSQVSVCLAYGLRFACSIHHCCAPCAAYVGSALGLQLTLLLGLLSVHILPGVTNSLHARLFGCFNKIIIIRAVYFMLHASCVCCFCCNHYNYAQHAACLHAALGLCLGMQLRLGL
jgi:hypothetical protein